MQNNAILQRHKNNVYQHNEMYNIKLHSIAFCMRMLRQDGLKSVRFDRDMSVQAFCMTNLLYYYFA